MNPHPFFHCLFSVPELPCLRPVLAHTLCSPFPAPENVTCTHPLHSLFQEKINLFLLLSSTKKELTQFALTLSVSFYLIRASAAWMCAMLRSLPSNSIVFPISGPCVCPLVATRIGINKFLPFTPVSF